MVSKCTESMQEITTKFSTTADFTEGIDIEDCDDVTIEYIMQTQSVVVDTEAWTNLEMTAAIEEKLDVKIEETAKALAEAGIGFADSEVDVVNYTKIVMKAAFSQIMKTMSDTMIHMNENIKCHNSHGIHFKYITQEQYEKSTWKSKQVAKMQTQVKSDIREYIETHVESEAKGFNPSILILIAILVIAAIAMVFVGGGVKLVLSVNFWFLLAMLGTGITSWLFGSSFTGTWPGQKIYSTDTEQKKKEKEKHNKSLRKGSGIALGVCGGLMLLFGFMAYRGLKKAPAK